MEEISARVKALFYQDELMQALDVLNEAGGM